MTATDMKWSGLVMMGSLVLTLVFSRCGNEGDVIDTVACPIVPAVNKIHVAEAYYNKKVQLKTQIFYRAAEYNRIWLKKRRPEKMFDAFVTEVKESGRYGFEPGDYHVSELEKAVSELYDNRKRTNADISNLDIRITASFFLFTTHLIEGRVRYPGAREFFWKRGMPLENDIALLLKMESAADLRTETERLHPKDLQYEKLQKALATYRKLEPYDTFPPIPTRISISPGDSSGYIPVIRKKLQLMGYSVKEPDTVRVYDGALVKAVKLFQLRHGLDRDGTVDAETARFLNVSFKRKADLISLNLERLRWLPHLQGKGHEIVINVPEYMLRVYYNNDEKMKIRVVLGAEFTPTPVFHDTLKYIVFSPTWSVPTSIFKKEFLPKLQEDPAHFDPERFTFYKNGEKIDPLEEDWNDRDLDSAAYRVIENPGEVNSLGNVKFIMPNNFSVYLHDTPADRLFNRQERALSHGCIRLEKPLEFAAYLLSGQEGWNEKTIRAAMASGKPLKVDLEEPFPVYIVYRTTWVDEDNALHFRDDVYGHDQRHLARLQK